MSLQDFYKRATITQRVETRYRKVRIIQSTLRYSKPRTTTNSITPVWRDITKARHHQDWNKIKQNFVADRMGLHYSPSGEIPLYVHTNLPVRHDLWPR